MLNDSRRIALVTGANKGIGFEIARQLALSGVTVLLGARDAGRGRSAADELAAEGLDVSFVQIDVCHAESIATAAGEIEARHGRLDILINNAGIADYSDGAPGKASLEAVRRELETNFVGALAVTQAMLPLMRKAGTGRIVNMTSSLGSLTLNGDPDWPFYGVRLIGYNASKAALNMLTIQLNAELGDSGITAVSVCPGLVNTDLSGHRGDRSPAEAAAFPVRMALVGQYGPEGACQSETGAVPW